MTHLNLQRCYFITDVSPLRNMKMLQELKLCSIHITDISPLAGLGALTRLNIMSCTGITDISPLAGLRANLKVIGRFWRT